MDPGACGLVHPSVHSQVEKILQERVVDAGGRPETTHHACHGRRSHKFIAAVGVKQRAHPEYIPRQKQTLGARVPHREREVALQVRWTGR